MFVGNGRGSRALAYAISAYPSRHLTEQYDFHLFFFFLVHVLVLCQDLTFIMSVILA